ncbi:hypothetical protein GX50_05562 [[Emmonsia] crescens]|uniref:Uncharacterized protein n=1 Tax=[Emmonsia] crescens TaxID=73230 RepID=A0A2B7ZET7_9EURO|nr:hypothetical protein GX50_05562 [Emmonsia crescens]
MKFISKLVALAFFLTSLVLAAPTENASAGDPSAGDPSAGDPSAGDSLESLHARKVPDCHAGDFRC